MSTKRWLTEDPSHKFVGVDFVDTSMHQASSWTSVRCYPLNCRLEWFFCVNRRSTNRIGFTDQIFVNVHFDINVPIFLQLQRQAWGILM
uniref:Uncharacterized protein n=1 Tax=Romanomermis culicivorax TaxID=13658 RepID=A0A915K541_ROMCU